MALCERESERARLAELIEGVSDRGGALVVRGEAGIGKSALLAEIEAPGLRTLTAVGVEAEHHLPYAGLHQLLFPLRKDIDGLPATQGEALRTALGLADGPRPEVFLVGMAVLNLLAEAAAHHPLLLVVDDAHWLDPNSQDVLAFVARRLESEPIALVAAIRDGEPARMATLPTLSLKPLTDSGAAELLARTAPELSSAERRRVVASAAGNPLALRELTSGDVTSLEQAFAVRARKLPPQTRTVLLVAAVNDTNALHEALCAAKADLAALTPAVDADLVTVAEDTLAFRHPLVRSAIVKAADPCQRQAAHQALAEVVSDEDRRVWHRAAATTGPDEALAAELQESAERLERRGGVDATVTALARSARLSESSQRKAEWLLKAATLAVETGQRDLVDRLLADASTLDLTDNQRAVVRWLPTAFDDGLRDDVSGPGELADLAIKVLADGDLDQAMLILWGAAMRCFWVEPGPTDRCRLTRAADRMPLARRDPRLVAINAYVTPFERGEAVLADLAELARHGDRDASVDRFLGSASMLAGAFDLAARFSASAQPGLRAQGRLALLARALGVQAWSSVRLGDLATALSAAEEGQRLAVETSQPYIHGLTLATQAEIAALRGDYDKCEELAAQAERIGLAAGARPVLATVQLARGIAALGEGRHADAFANLMRLNDPADPAYQMALRCYQIAELTEAAVRCDQLGVVGELVQEFEMHAMASPSPALHSGLRHARAVLAPDHEAEKLFRAALDAETWPLERGRTQLAYGEWLRRQRRPVDSRPQLRAARETFEALGVTAWAERARHELRAAGEASPDAHTDAVGELTPHELHIARLAAEGLTNREIGQQLYLSHRTVSTHLHRIFPKLGITSRTELREVLGR
ncbi:ATP-binding protein [Kutzneria sp. CA-103260]|uniref:ATP-binding protein n=1 Tax=Kutzneria sp. CA-103260 TaxID=2802641 RepID=UPI001BA50FB7|nr:AAA family ATPase [Kutzneria sp. CA-103260]QUQ63567.1 LuxR family transcriptional regulator [Kutzneria sp. CA-103260]